MMQCASNIPVYYHARDLNVGASGVPLHMYNGDAKNGEERGYSILFPPCTMDQYLGYPKEVLGQIMQNHEATFRYQVQELHRLYRRQSELTDEIRSRHNFVPPLHPQTRESNYFSSQARFPISQLKPHATSWILGGDCSDGKFSVLTSESIHQPPTFVAKNLQEHGSLPRKDIYDEVNAMSFTSRSGHEKRLLNLELPADVRHDAEVEQFQDINDFDTPKVTDNTLLKVPETQHTRNSELESADISCRKRNFLIDLNEPIQLEAVASISSYPCQAYAHHLEFTKKNQCVSGNGKSELLPPEESKVTSCDKISDAIKSSADIDLNMVPVSCLAEDSEIDKKFLKINAWIDLNSSMVDELSAPSSSTNGGIKCAGKADLDGPVSPDNKEGSPPRGKSDENQLETSPLLLPQVGVDEPFVDPDRTAAETLVVISCSGVLEYPKFDSESVGYFFNLLCRFTEIASATGDNLDNEIMKFQNDATDADEGFSNHVEDFGARAQKIPKENSVNLSPFVGKKNETGSSSATSGRGRPRGKKPHLPSPAAPFKNLDTVDAVHNTGLLKRKAGRNSNSKSQKRTKSCSNIVKKSISSSSKQPTNRRKQQAVLQGWGTTKIRRGVSRRAREFLHIHWK